MATCSNRGAQVPTPAASISPASPGPSNGKPHLSCLDEPSPDEAEVRLGCFRDEMLPYLPFMTLSPSMSARDLRQRYPFLWLCIMAITAKSPIQQAALSHAVRSNLGRLMLVEGEKSLDLMYGTATCLSWYAAD